MIRRPFAAVVFAYCLLLALAAPSRAELACEGADRDCLIDALQNAQGGDPLAAAMKLGAIGDEAAVAALSEALGASDEMLATAALHALMTIGEPAVPALAAAAVDGNKRVREYAAYGLARIGTGYTYEQVRPLADDESNAVRVRAVSLLARLDCAEAFPGLRALTEDHAIRVRAAAVEAIGACDHLDAMGVLVFAMSDLYPAVGDAAARALAARGADAMPHLTSILSSGKAYTRIRACVAVGLIGNPSANAVLVRLLDHRDPYVARAAIRTLGITGDKLSLRALRYMRHPERSVDGVTLGKHAEEAMFRIAARIKKKPEPLTR